MTKKEKKKKNRAKPPGSRTAATATVGKTGDGDDQSTMQSKHHKKTKKSGADESCTDMGAFRDQLKQIGCQIIEVESDGNCLFRSLADQIFGDPSQHEQVREKIVDFIEKQREDFEPFMEDDESFDKYIKRMRGNGIWGGNQELYAAGCFFQSNVVIHQFGAPRMYLECSTNKIARTLHVCYSSGEHYDSVRSLQDTGDGVPLPIPLDSEMKKKQDTAQEEIKEKSNFEDTIDELEDVCCEKKTDGSSSSSSSSSRSRNVFDFQTSQDAAGHQSKPKRNKPCPCNSGIKYKDCCKKKNNKADTDLFENAAKAEDSAASSINSVNLGLLVI